MSNALQPLHEKMEAEFRDYGGIQVVETFGEPQAEYAAIRNRAGIIDFAQRGVLELRGKDRLSFLNNLLTNETYSKEKKNGMPAGSGVYAFFLNTKGRIVADMNVLELGDRTLLEMDARLVGPTKAAFEKYLFAEQVSFADLTQTHSVLMVMGPGAREAINSVVDAPVEELSALSGAIRRVSDHEVVLFRDDPASVPGYGMICPREGVADIWSQFAAEKEGRGEEEKGKVGDEPSVRGHGPQSSSHGSQPWRFKGLARPVGWAVFNACRIEAGRVIFGIDFDDSLLPAETGELSRAVSFTKGCYLGQEVVARMHARQQVARQLVGIRMEEDALPVAGTKVYDQDQNEIGGITSSTASPVLSMAAIAIGLLKKPHFAEGTQVWVPAEGKIRKGKVVRRPFIGTLPDGAAK